jgi:thioredoxin 1
MANQTRSLWVVVVVVAAVAAIAYVKSARRSLTQADNTAASQPAASAPASARLPRLVDLGAGKCLACKQLAPILEELRKEYAGRLEVVFIDVWENPNAGTDYGIQIIPTQIFYDASGKELDRHTGFISKQDILARFKELGVSIPDSK